MLAAALVGLASDGRGAAQFGQTVDALVGPLVQKLWSTFIGSDAGSLKLAPLTAPLQAAAAALLTVALGPAFRFLSWWAGLFVVLGVITAGYALAFSGVPVPSGPLLIAVLTAYGVGLIARRSDRPGPEREAQRIARQQELLMPPLAAGSSAAILTFDGHGRIRSSNRAAETMFGYAPHELLGTPFRHLLASGGECQVPVRRDGSSCELRARRRNGQCFELGAAFSTLDLGEERVRVAILQDVSELQTPRAARALHDPVTGLPQEVLFADRLEQAILAAERAGQPLALLIIHLKLLRMIRETLGDAFADELLGLIVQRLREVLRRSDTLARVGDAELALLLPNPTDEGAATIKAEAIADRLHQPFVVDGLDIGLQIHVGLATYPLDGRRSLDLWQRAEVAMLAARRAQRTRASYAEAETLPVSEELALVDQLREGIEDGQFFLEFLPKLDLGTRRLDGVEALVRWQHPERGVVAADKFIDIAERHGLVLPLTLRVIALAIGQLHRWQDEGETLSVAINLSVELLQNPQFPLIFDHILRATGGRPDQLLLEISERCIAAHPNTILHVAKILKERGCQLSLDDFGTGSLSLPLLQRLPVVELKIDRSFVTAMARDHDAAVVVRSALSLAHSLGLRVVAVGVEDQATLDMLAELGCAQVQGYYIGPPMTAAKLQEWQAALPRPEPAGERADAEAAAA